MTKLPFARKCNNDLGAPSARQHFPKDKPGISRFASALLIVALLAQGFLIIPFQKVKASPQRSAIAPISQSFDPLDSLKRISNDYISSIFDLTALPALADNFLPKLQSSIASGGEWLISRGEQLPGRFSSIIGFFAPRSAAGSRGSNLSPMFVAYPNIKYDFSGEGKSDIGRWRASGTDFTVRSSSDSTFSTYYLGSSAAVAAPGDFDGDGKTD